jgi:hypothetical protein
MTFAQDCPGPTAHGVASVLMPIIFGSDQGYEQISLSTASGIAATGCSADVGGSESAPVGQHVTETDAV